MITIKLTVKKKTLVKNYSEKTPFFGLTLLSHHINESSQLYFRNLQYKKKNPLFILIKQLKKGGGGITISELKSLMSHKQIAFSNCKGKNLQMLYTQSSQNLNNHIVFVRLTINIFLIIIAVIYSTKLICRSRVSTTSAQFTFLF